MFRISDIHVGDYIGLNDNILHKVIKVHAVNITYLNYWGVAITIRFDKIKYLVSKSSVAGDNNQIIKLAVGGKNENN